jgi:hypothetical protein
MEALAIALIESIRATPIVEEAVDYRRGNERTTVPPCLRLLRYALPLSILCNCNGTGTRDTPRESVMILG